MADSQDIKDKLGEVADDLRKIADAGHPHAGHLQQEAATIKKVAEQCEVILDHPAPIGQSGQGIRMPTPQELTEAATNSQPHAVRPARREGWPAVP